MTGTGGTVVRTVATSGTITLDSVQYRVGPRRAFEQVLVITDGNHQPGDKIIIADLLGEILAEHARPAAGISYVGNGRRPRRPPQQDEPSPKS